MDSINPEAGYYSQHGEDFVLSLLFPGKRDGIFVEVGCIDGRRLSNTLHFEKIGWKGLCIEAHNDYIEMLRKNRPASMVVHAAIGDHDEDHVNFFANSRGSLSSLDESRKVDFEGYGQYFTGFELQKVPMRTLTSVFEACNIKETIDFISIDIEGHEVHALRGLDFERYKPTVFVVESDSYAHKRKIDALLSSRGYDFLCSVDLNLFYSLDEKHKDIVAGKTFRNVKIKHTLHPLDAGGDKVICRDVVCHDKYQIVFRSLLRSLWLSLKKKMAGLKR